MTNAARIFTYVPQLRAVWRSADGARDISLLTWGSWVVANATAVAYGAFVAGDLFFTLIATLNLVCCAAVTLVAARRRRAFQAAEACRTATWCRKRSGIRLQNLRPRPRARLRMPESSRSAPLSPQTESCEEDFSAAVVAVLLAPECACRERVRLTIRQPPACAFAGRLA
ncbi:hypothetical protein [Variovorax ginsengisoli]|uniref:Uncharacterized protein n=1 Tax=Variovorax ginsengisoli TaxID=363844 RepID=A0ABT8SKD4_9BURK|nr:hypothetical protein [Variovorax ginsengisoli]MDN8618871.1 hypothetical protein [Variovorax ginsengisoli]MDO1538041.1 hypothetical protein [Variovorax ginsengisoli]